MNIEGNPIPQGGTRTSVGGEHGATSAAPALIVPIQEEPEIVATTAATVPGGPVLSYLTPDAMLIYCQTRLDGIDTQCKDIMAKQEKNARSQAALGDLLSSLTHYENGYEDPKVQNELVDAYDRAIGVLGPDSAAGQKLAENRTQWLLAGGDAKTLKEEMGSLINATKSLQADLNSNSEIDMIHLQSLMSQRQTAVQLTTNILQSLNDQANKIVANIGH